MKKHIVLLLTVSLLVIACNDDKKTGDDDKKETTMSASSDSKEDRNKKIVMASMESFMKGDLDGTFKDAAPGFVDHADGSVPPITNIDSLKGFIRMMLSSIEGYKADNVAYYADGDRVFVHGNWGGTFKNDLMGIKATGKPVSFTDVDIFKLNDEGKITEHWSVQNIAAVLMAASAMK